MKTAVNLLSVVLMLPVSSFARSAPPSWPDPLKEAQIDALTTGDIGDLKSFGDEDGLIQITANWTAIAAKQFMSAKADVSRESALLTSEFIFRGAHVFVAEGGREEKREEAERNLQKFIAAEIELGKQENPRQPTIGEATFVAARKSVCPLWPFCR
jgi:hypothetical protein